MSYKVVIVKTKAQSLKQAEQFLRNRQWQVFSTTNIRDAIAAVIQKQPDFILIAADHPNRKVRVLPKLIGQAFPVRVIGFVESTANSGLALLHECALEYNVYPPVSGPAIERIVLKIKKDDERREIEKQKAQENALLNPDGQTSSSSPEGNFSGSGENSTSPSSFSVGSGGSGALSAREMLQQLVNDDDEGGPGHKGPNIISGSGPGGQDGPSIQIQKGAPQGGNATWSQSSSDETGSFHSNPYASNWNTQADRALPDSDENSFTDPTATNPPGGPSMMRSDGGSPGGFPSAPSDSAFKNHGTPNEGENSFTQDESNPNSPGNNENPFDSGSGSGNWNRSTKAPILEHDPVDLRKTRKIPTYKQDPHQYPDRESIFVRGTQQALDESVDHQSPLPHLEEIKVATNVACITIESPRFSGYLVAALGKDRQIDNEFLNQVKERLFNFLRSNGESVKDEDSMALKLEEVDFEDWAIHQAEFLRKSVHGNTEIAMAFFPSKETSVRLEESASENMLKLSIDELRDDVKVDFDLYIYMPSNQRYLLYTPEGRTLYGQQKGRLSEKGITHMHLRKESQGQVKRYRAQAYLNDCIANYKTKPKLKKTP